MVATRYKQHMNLLCIATLRIYKPSPYTPGIRFNNKVYYWHEASEVPHDVGRRLFEKLAGKHMRFLLKGDIFIGVHNKEGGREQIVLLFPMRLRQHIVSLLNKSSKTGEPISLLRINGYVDVSEYFEWINQPVTSETQPTTLFQELKRGSTRFQRLFFKPKPQPKPMRWGLASAS